MLSRLKLFVPLLAFVALAIFTAFILSGVLKA